MSENALSANQLNGLYQYAYTLCQQADDAYDLLQSAMESYLVKCKCQTQRIETPEAYVRTLIRHRFIDLYRHRQRWDAQPYEEASNYDISPVDCEKLTVDGQALEKVWPQIDPLDRDILYHMAVLGYSTDECCQLLQMPRGSLLSRLHRLRKHWQSSPLKESHL